MFKKPVNFTRALFCLFAWSGHAAGKALGEPSSAGLRASMSVISVTVDSALCAAPAAVFGDGVRTRPRALVREVARLNAPSCSRSTRLPSPRAARCASQT